MEGIEGLRGLGLRAPRFGSFEFHPRLDFTLGPDPRLTIRWKMEDLYGKLGFRV